MNLSKIPEPSEDEIEMAMYLVRNPPESHSAYLCVIAHLLRHGIVLAEAMTDLERINLVIWDSEKKAAISFFEKFGGNDER